MTISQFIASAKQFGSCCGMFLQTAVLASGKALLTSDSIPFAIITDGSTINILLALVMFSAFPLFQPVELIFHFLCGRESVNLYQVVQVFPQSVCAI